MADIFGSFPSKYLKPNDLENEDGEVVTIESVAMELVGFGEQQSTKPVMYFREYDKGIILNKGMSTVLAGMFGPETDDWPGKRVKIYGTVANNPQGEPTDVVRIRNLKPDAPRPAPAARKPDPATQAAPVVSVANEDADDSIPF